MIQQTLIAEGHTLLLSTVWTERWRRNVFRRIADLYCYRGVELQIFWAVGEGGAAGGAILVHEGQGLGLGLGQGPKPCTHVNTRN